jgi:hypothetical protein
MRASVSDAVIPRAARVVLAVLAVTTVVLAVVGAAGALHRPGDPATGGVFTDGERRALGAAPALRGAEPAPPDPRVDLADPEAVARAYLTAAHAVLPGDAGHTQLRAAAYAEPGSPAAAVGVVVLDPPQPDAYRTAQVGGLEPVGADGNRRGYRAQLTTTSGPPAGPRAVTHARALVVLARQPDGRWLVVAETADGEGNPDPSAGEG